MEKLIRVLEGITATLWAITILYSIFFFSLGGFLLNDIFQEILIGLITGAISSLVFTSISYFAFLHKIPEKTYEKIEKLLKATRKNCAFRERKYGTQRANSKFKCTAKSAA